MADVDTIEAAIAAERGADLIATTLCGYTANSTSLNRRDHPSSEDGTEKLLDWLSSPS